MRAPPRKKPMREKFVVVSKGSFHHFLFVSSAPFWGAAAWVLCVLWELSAIFLLRYVNSGAIALSAISMKVLGNIPRKIVPTAVINRTRL